MSPLYVHKFGKNATDFLSMKQSLIFITFTGITVSLETILGNCLNFSQLSMLADINANFEKETII